MVVGAQTLAGWFVGKAASRGCAPAAGPMAMAVWRMVGRSVVLAVVGMNNAVWADGPSRAPSPPVGLRLELSEIAGRTDLVISPLRGQRDAPAAGEPAQDVHRGSLAETWRRALDNSYDLFSARARNQAQQEQVDVARGALLPRVDWRYGSGRETVRPGSFSNPATGRSAGHSEHGRRESSLIVRQPVVDRGASFELSRQRALARANQAALDNERNQVILDATAAHLEVLQYSLQVAFARDYQVALDELFEFVQARVEAGGASLVEAERIKARSISARSSAIESSGLLESALLTYQRLVGWVPSRLPTDDVLAAQAMPSIADALQQMLRDNPTLVAAREQERALEFEGKAAGARMLPKLDVEVGNYQSWGTGSPDAQSNEARAMLVLSWNAFNGGADRAQVRAAAARLEEARYRTRDQERRVEESLRIAFNTLDAVVRRTQSAQDELASNQKVVAAFRTQLKSGARQLLDVLDAEQRLYQSRVEWLRLTVLQANLSMQALRQLGSLTVPEADYDRVEVQPESRVVPTTTPAPPLPRPAVMPSPVTQESMQAAPVSAPPPSSSKVVDPETHRVPDTTQTNTLPIRPSADGLQQRWQPLIDAVGTSPRPDASAPVAQPSDLTTVPEPVLESDAVGWRWQGLIDAVGGSPPRMQGR